jgi:hypothetical protein
MTYHFNGKLIGVRGGHLIEAAAGIGQVPTPHAPTNASEAQKWAEQQAKDYLKPDGIPLSKDDAYKFAQQYAETHGWPTTPSEAQQFLVAWASKQAAAAGVPPEVLAAGDLIKHPPTNASEAEAWLEEVGKRYAARYGIPITKEQLMQAAVHTASEQFGVDPTVAKLTVQALADGELSSGEAHDIAVAACAWAGAVLGQGLGIPAPLGAFIGSALGDIVVTMVFTAFGIGKDDAKERRRKLEEARQRWREAQTKWNTEMLRAAWNAYLHYFEAAVDAVQKMLDQYKDALAETGGLRYYESTKIMAPGGIVQRKCSVPEGCLYFASGSESVLIRQNPWKHEMPIQAVNVTCAAGAKIKGVPNAYAALQFWLGAPRITPTGQTGMTDWEQISKLAVELAGAEGKATQAAIGLAQGFRDDIQRGAAAMAFVIRDAIRVMSWVTVKHALQDKETAERSLEILEAPKILEAQKYGATKSLMTNSVLLALGAGALAGWATAKLH